VGASQGKAIFAALSELDDSTDVRCFKLVDGKVTLAHRKTWPALVRLGRDGVIAIEQLASLQQEHMPTGEHRNFVTPFPIGSTTTPRRPPIHCRRTTRARSSPGSTPRSSR